MQELTTAYRHLINNCRPDVVTGPRVISLLDAAREFMGSFEREVGEAEAARARVAFRSAAQTLLRQAHWLEDDARAALADFIEEQQEFLSEDGYRFTNDFFSTNILHWQRDLARFVGRPGLSFLEVGSYEGKSACWLLRNVLTHESGRLTCVDVFEQGKSQGVFDTTGRDSASMTAEDRFDHNIRQTGAGHRVTKLKGLSGVLLRTLPLASYDFIYIDGSHTARDVLEDAVMAWPLLKPGGRITFDDYLWKDHPEPLLRPQMAIDAFLKVYEGHYRLVRCDYQVTLEKLS
ncbi:MAG TPA: class I SAM-dependent methyltransferase [Pyrinomonadaceae bacterium]|jgi:predicted O-methyltransferase YrrM